MLAMLEVLEGRGSREEPTAALLPFLHDLILPDHKNLGAPLVYVY